VHRALTIAVAPERTDELLEELQRFEDHVITISVLRHASIKPPGDVVEIQVLNRAASAVLEVIERHHVDGTLSVASSQVDSISDREHEQALNADIDEAPWDDVRAQLREHTQPGINFFGLMFLGGVVAACGLVSSPTSQALALVASSILAPAFEPLAELSLGVVLRRRDLLWRGARSAVLGYLCVVLAGALAMIVLKATSSDMSQRFITNQHVGELANPSTASLLISAAGAVAGGLVITAYRMPLLPGPIVAVQIVSSAAMVGAAAAAGKASASEQALQRFAIDATFIVAAGLLVFWLKERLVHRRVPDEDARAPASMRPLPVARRTETGARPGCRSTPPTSRPTRSTPPARPDRRVAALLRITPCRERTFVIRGVARQFRPRMGAPSPPRLILMEQSRDEEVAIPCVYERVFGCLRTIVPCSSDPRKPTYRPPLPAVISTVC
jgi:Domain of unknown function (DUF389)